MLALVGLFLRLALWQYNMAQQQKRLARTAVSAITEPPKDLSKAVSMLRRNQTLPRYVHVRADGHYDGRRQVVFTEISRPGGETVGAYVMTPFVADAGYVVLVNRGWVPIGSNGKVARSLEVSSKRRTIIGYLAPFPQPGIRLGKNAPQMGWPKYYLYPRWTHLARLYGPKLIDRVVLLAPSAAGGYFRHWILKPRHGPYRNYGYMVQWLALATAVLITWLLLTVRYLRARQRERSQ